MENLYKSSILRTCILLIFFAFIAMDKAYGQSPSTWTLQADQNGVQFYSATANCGGKNMLIFKFENGNAAAKRVNYNVIIQSEGRNVPLLPQSLELAASETKTGDCDSNKELIADLKGVDNYQLKVVMVIN